MRLSINIILLIFFTLGYSNVKPKKEFRKGINNSRIDSLFNIYGNNKCIPKEYEEQIIFSLCFFPDLKEVEIEFIYSNINTTMRCRPKISSILKKNRKYLIIINNSKNFEGILLKDAPFNAQIGIIGHEFCHIVDYEKRSTIGIIRRGIEYLNHESKKKYEYKIDSITIERGLGWQLYDWARFSMIDNTVATNEYKTFKKKFYLQPTMIINYINKLDIYK